MALGLGLAGYGVAGSYQTVSGLAERRGIPLASLVPVGIDGGLIGVVVLDLVLSWIGQPIGWLRQFVRVLTVGTVAADADAETLARLGVTGTVPSESTFRRTLQRLDADVFDGLAGAWAARRATRGPKERRVIAVDGKTLRGSGDDQQPGRGTCSPPSTMPTARCRAR